MLLSFSYSFAASLLLGARHHTNYSLLPHFYAICTKYFAPFSFIFFFVNRFTSLLYVATQKLKIYAYLSPNVSLLFYFSPFLRDIPFFFYFQPFNNHSILHSQTKFDSFYVYSILVTVTQN